METLVKILAATAILGVLVSWITYGILAWMQKSVPWLLQEPGWKPNLPTIVKKTRLVPKGTRTHRTKVLPSGKLRLSFSR